MDGSIYGIELLWLRSRFREGVLTFELFFKIGGALFYSAPCQCSFTLMRLAGMPQHNYVPSQTFVINIVICALFLFCDFKLQNSKLGLGMDALTQF